jgi:hypothetical protein
MLSSAFDSSVARQCVSFEFSTLLVLVRRASPIGGRPGSGMSPMNSGTLLAGTDGFS